MSRIAAISTTFGRANAHRITGEIVDQLLTQYADLITQAQLRGLIRADLDARAIATFVQSYGLGLVIFDLDANAAQPDKMLAVIMAAVEGFLLPEA